MDRYLCVLGGGAVGSLARYLVSRTLLQRFPDVKFPIGTFAVNIAGSFAIGILMTLLVERWRVPAYWQLIGVVGFLGGFTTFSSFEFDAYVSARGGHHLLALTYLVTSVVAGYCAVWLGASLVSKH